jgi:hypothetical protein
MNDRVDDEARLRRLLSDAVSDVEPENRLDELRASVHPSPKVVPMARPRSWHAAAGIVATAAVIGVVAYLTSVIGDRGNNVGPATDGGTTLPSVATRTATDPAVSQSTAAPQGHAAAVYYLGEAPRGIVLYREWSARPPATKPLDFAVGGLMSEPEDPDYRTPWQAGWLGGARESAGRIEVAVDGAPAGRPPAMTAREASEAVQQVIYTVQAAVADRLPVQFTRHGKPTATVLGVAAGRPLAQGAPLQVLSRMSISDPAEDSKVQRGRLVVTGVNNSFEANVVVRLERQGKVIRTKSGIAAGYQAPRLFPWRVVLDTAKLPPGRYTIVASNDDPSGRGQADRDTRTIELT